MPVETQSALEQLQRLFSRRWYCGVFGSGFHNGSKCGPDDPHGNWGCEYRWIAAHLPDTERTRQLLDIDG